VVKGNRLVLDRAYLGLTIGRPVVVTGVRTDLHGVTDSEVVVVADLIFNQGRTELVFATGLANEYERESVTVNANVAFATHGETKDEALGSGDSDVPFQAFALAQAPLTYVPATSLTGAASTLEVRVNDLLWEEVDFLYGHGPEEHVYITRDDDEGRTHVTFGDGRTGARVPTGRENVHVVYRLGMGPEGLVREGQLTLLGTKPLGVRGVSNPVAAGDAADRDSRDDTRRNAALPIRTLDRIVSLKDYEDFARAFTGIAKALATWTWDGHRRGVFVTVAGVGGKPVPEGGLTHANLLAATRVAGEDDVPLRVQSYVAAFFRVAAGVRVDPAYRVELVLPAVEAALRAAFSFDAREFGQPVSKSEVVAAMQAVPGVVAVDLDLFERTDRAGGRRVLVAARRRLAVADRLTAATPRAGTNVTVPAELLTLDPRPVDLRVIAA
jgi:predicted phage baseplate assembly protein